MNLIELFHTQRDQGCVRTLHMLSNLTKRSKNIVLITYDVDSSEGMSKAIEKRIQGVPLIVINGKTIIKGMPFSEQQILDKMNRK